MRPSAARKVGRWDNVRFNALQTVPQLLRGMFTRRPRVASLIDRLHPDPQGVRLVRELRRHYESDYLWLSLAGSPSLLVLDPRGIRDVLDASPEVYGPPDLKVRGMSHFQPGAVTISTGEEWHRRRAFNDEVLGVAEPIHPSAALFLRVVELEVRMLRGAHGPTSAHDRHGAALSWRDLHRAFRRITAGVVFGARTDAEPVLSGLDTLMRGANRIVGKPDGRRLVTFQGAIRQRVCAPETGGLAAAACPHLQPGDPLPVAGQVPHWLFAMKDTLATNCAYALALVASHPDVQERARAEVASAHLDEPASVRALTFVEGCLREAMRLWPTTPMIVRKALRDAVLRGHPIGAGAQVIIHNGFNHRNSESVARPDAFRPEARPPGVWDYRFNSMSNGPQACAGRELALFLGKAFLGLLLRSHAWTLVAPRLDPGAPVPHAFDHRALVVKGTPAS